MGLLKFKRGVEILIFRAKALRWYETMYCALKNVELLINIDRSICGKELKILIFCNARLVTIVTIHITDCKSLPSVGSGPARPVGLSAG